MTMRCEKSGCGDLYARVRGEDTVLRPRSMCDKHYVAMKAEAQSFNEKYHIKTAEVCAAIQAGDVQLAGFLASQEMDIARAAADAVSAWLAIPDPVADSA